MYATEIATFRCKAPLSTDELTATNLSKTAELLHRQKGMHGCHYGAAAEDPLSSVYMMHWADLPTHEEFHDDEAQYGQLLGLLGPILAGPPGVRHYFFPSDKDLREVLGTGRVEMRSFFFAKEDKGFGERLEEVARTVRGVKGVKGAVWAWSYEEVEHEKLAAPGKVVRLLIGWESKAAEEAWSGSDRLAALEKEAAAAEVLHFSLVEGRPGE